MTYQGKHRDPSPEATTRCDERDHEVLWTALWPCKHHHARHTAYTCKLREAS